MNGCGTSTSLESEAESTDLLRPGDKAQMKTGFSNIIIIQMSEDVQEIWDSARKINCEWVNLIKKRVEFEPFEVMMLDFEEVKFEGDSVDCWMDLQVGKYPDSEEIHSAVKIGEQLSMLVYAKDNEDMYDMHIKECFAYSSEEYDGSNTVKLQLTDERGCVMKNKLLDGFYTRREPNTEGGFNIVAYGYLSAFKFPDVLDVFTTCEVEICKGGCQNKCDEEDEDGDQVLGQGLEDPETTTEPFREGVELFGQPLSCNDPETARVDPRCRRPKALPDDEPDCDNALAEDPRCPPDCVKDPFSARCPPNCLLSRGVDPRCPCSADPTHPNCPPDCEAERGRDPRCPCEDAPLHPQCPPDCTLYANIDPRCPCSVLPTHPNCPPECELYTGQDPRCPCELKPFHSNCPADCKQNAGKDPRCPCSKYPLHENCLDCNKFRGKDPRCPCEDDPTHSNCEPDCDRFAGQDPRCPCNKYPLHPNCPPNCLMFTGKDPRCPCEKNPFHLNCPPQCDVNAGKDPRCPCTKYPFHRNCPPNCKRYIGKDPRCPCSEDPFNPKCPPDCVTYIGEDSRCPCSNDPFNPKCPPNCELYIGQDPRCPCSKDPFNPQCPPDCDKFGQDDSRCKPDCERQPESEECGHFCDDNPHDPICEGVELFGQPGVAPTTSTTTTTTTTTTTRRPRTTRRGRQREEPEPQPEPIDDGHHGGHHGHHGDPRYHAFHSFHYDPGDGRRNRNGKKRLGKRSIDFEEEEDNTSPRNKSGSARLVRHIRVISPDESPDFEGGTLDWNEYHGHIRGAVCIPSIAFFSGLTLLLGALGLTVFIITVQCLKYRRIATKHQHHLHHSPTTTQQHLFNSSTKSQFVEYKHRDSDSRLSRLSFIQ